jgi:hypothetical protein
LGEVAPGSGRGDRQAPGRAVELLPVARGRRGGDGSRLPPSEGAARAG